jgi:sugar-specific transcriptional regulator TrmB
MERDILHKIGLGKNEIDVYLALLQYGEGSVTTIAKVCTVHRVNIYDAVRNLIGKGLVTELKDKRTTLFKANDPKNILSYLEIQKDSVRDILPSLQKSFVSHD